MSGPHESLPEYVKAVESLLRVRYGIDSNDVGTECIVSGRAAGYSPDDLVEWIENHYDLDRLDTYLGIK